MITIFVGKLKNLPGVQRLKALPGVRRLKKLSRGKMVALIVVIFQVLGFISSINAVMSARTSQGTIAWVVSLNTFPYLAVPAYWIFGRSQFQGYVTAHQEDHLGLLDSFAHAHWTKVQ